MKTTVLVAFALFFTVSQPGRAAEAEIGNDAYELTAELAVSILPEPLRSYYAHDLATLKSKVIASCGDVAASARPTLSLDANATSSDRRARLDAVRRFPRLGSDLDDPGLLRGSIQSQVNVLRAIRPLDGTGHATIEQTAKVIHLATDAAMPFNTTSGAHWGATDAARFLQDHQARYHEVLIGRLRKRFESELRIDPSRVKPTTKVADAAMETAREAYPWIDPLLDIEAAVAAEFVAKPGEDLKKHEERFLDELADRAYPILEARIEAGALLAANLIVGTWVEAGKPALADTEPIPVNDPPVAEVTPKVETKSATAFFGSKDSTVFHKLDCVHLARVKPENRVSFDDVKSAAAKGRKPCKTCKPDAAAASAPTSP